MYQPFDNQRASRIIVNRKLVPLALVLILLFSTAPLTSGYSNGIYNQGSGCGGGYCHGPNTNAVVSMSGQPASYTPGQSYTLSISVTGGASASQGGSESWLNLLRDIFGDKAFVKMQRMAVTLTIQ